MKAYYLIFLSLVLSSSCATTFTVFTDYDKNAKIYSYQTFNIINHSESFPLGLNPRNIQRIDKAITREMGDLGLTKSVNPDLVISWFLNIEKMTNYSISDCYNHENNRRSFYPEVNQISYDLGTFTMDLIDLKKMEVVWHGRTSRYIVNDTKDSENKINDLVESMFQELEKNIPFQATYTSL